ncbi:ATP-binding protein [Pseudomonas lundensis]|uniref:ATP-binding protein n=1 Tax=Serratia proteamaculans TaxID=28151 RepID=UPI002981FC69|nr:ATP-binding protein [Serratia proteamaculans]MDW5498322.1 ATP-binding protein [Serratia proteamaculans]MDW5503380.1 ATP-binding protein [Pseudomonas lundensis]
MDGGKKRLMGSLQLKLSLGLSIAIIVVALAAGSFSFYASFEEAHELQDTTLTQIAGLIRSDKISGLRQHDTPAPGNDEAAVIVQLIPTTGDSAAGSFLANVPLKTGFQTLLVGGVSFRVLIRPLSPELQVAVAQRTSERDEVAMESAWRTLIPLLVLIPILLLVVADLIKKSMQPISRLARDLEQRGEQDLTPLAVNELPSEITPFVAAINRLFGKVAGGVETQRRFVADAAHELRSPLTALSLQAERLSTIAMPEMAQQRMSRMLQGIKRTRHLLEQLLSLARVQQNTPRPMTQVSVQTVFRSVIEDMLPLAEAKNFDLGVWQPTEVKLTLNEADFVTVVKNLVENAIRYTPPGGIIDLQVRVENDKAIVTVEDSGPGIAAEHRQRVLDAFYRIEGSGQSGAGLGLSIVNAALAQMGGTLLLEDSRRHASGLQASVILPYP